MAEQVNVTIENPEVNANFTDTVVNIEMDPAGPIGPQGNPGEGVAPGGSAGQYLKKDSATDYDTSWDTLTLADLAAFDTDDITEGTTNLYSQWERNTYGVYDFLQPKDTTDNFIIGNDLDSSITNAFTGVAAVFNGDPSGGSIGINYFINFAYGTGFSGFGGIFVGGRARGVPAAPTQTLAGDFIGGYVFTAFDDAGGWAVSGGHLLPGVWSQAAANITAGALEENIWIGGLISPMIKFETDTNAIIFNEVQADSDITFYSDSTATLILDGGTTQALFYGGTTSLPGISFIQDTDTGFAFQGAFFSPNYVHTVIGGTVVADFTDDSARFRSGAATNVGIGFIASSGAFDTCIDGFYRLGSNNIGVSINATAVMDWNTTRLNFATGYKLENARVVDRVTSIVSNATPTVNTDNTDFVTITALATAITSMTTNLSGTPTNGQKLRYRIKDDGTGRAITWGASFASRGATLPTTTVANKVTNVGFWWNSVTSTWDCVAANTEV